VPFREELFDREILDLTQNELVQLTLPPSSGNLFDLYFYGNPLTRLVLPVAAPRYMYPSAEELQGQGVAVYYYPLQSRLAASQRSADAPFEMTLAGPPGIYRLQLTEDFAGWDNLQWVTNTTGSVSFDDDTTNQRRQGFYRAETVP